MLQSGKNIKREILPVRAEDYQVVPAAGLREEVIRSVETNSQKRIGGRRNGRRSATENQERTASIDLDDDKKPIEAFIIRNS
jgi:hypothetical protein